MKPVTGMDVSPRAAWHLVHACTCSAGYKRRKRSGWAGPVCAVLVVLALAVIGAGL